jgi:hypothetical protein
MGQIFRITFRQKNYTIELLNKNPISKDTTQIDILLENITYRLLKDNGSWVFENIQDPFLSDLSVTIGRSIALRYRI